MTEVATVTEEEVAVATKMVRASDIAFYVDELHGSIPVRRVSRAWTDMTQLVSSACRTWIGDRAHGPARLARLVSMDIM